MVKKTKLFSLFFLCIMLFPFVISFTNAQELIITLDTDEGELQTSFFNILRETRKFNGIAPDPDTGEIIDPSRPNLPLVMIIGDPYYSETVLRGSMPQLVNGELNTIHEWDIWYYYDIVLYTIGKESVIKGELFWEHDWLYHQGWGANDWEWNDDGRIQVPTTVDWDGVKDGSMLASDLGYTADVLWSGVVAHEEIFFESYDIQTWYDYSGDLTGDLSTWAWEGAFTYEVTIDPRYIFPPNVTVEDGIWQFNDFYAGFIGTYGINATGGLAEDFDVFVDGEQVAVNSEDITTTAAISSTGGLIDHPDAYYVGLETFPETVVPDKEVAGVNGSPAIMNVIASDDVIVEPPPFSPTALQILPQQRHAVCQFIGNWLRPKVTVLYGTHSYVRCDYYEGWLGSASPLLIFIGQGETKHSGGIRDVVLGWWVNNPYIKYSVRTGVRVQTLYEWEDNPAINNTPTGMPLSAPNFWSGDWLFHAGMSGTRDAEKPPGFFEQFWWLIAIVAVLALAYIYFRYGRRTRRPEEGPGAGRRTATRSLVITMVVVAATAVIMAVLSQFQIITIPVWVYAVVFGIEGLIIGLYGYNYYRSIKT